MVRKDKIKGGIVRTSVWGHVKTSVPRVFKAFEKAVIRLKEDKTQKG